MQSLIPLISNAAVPCSIAHAPLLAAVFLAVKEVGLVGCSELALDVARLQPDTMPVVAL